jgi:hypothetical protein
MPVVDFENECCVYRIFRDKDEQRDREAQMYFRCELEAVIFRNKEMSAGVGGSVL